MSASKTRGARPSPGTITLRSLATRTPSDDEIADTITLSSTPDGAAALADSMITVVSQAHNAGTLTLYMYALDADEAKLVAFLDRLLRETECSGGERSVR